MALRATPRWMDGLVLGMVLYVAAGALWMLTGIGGPQVTHYVGLLSDAPAALVCVIVASAVVYHTPRGQWRTGWIWLPVALALYFVGIAIGDVSWLRGRDPFPGPADFFFCAFYLTLAAAALSMIRAAAVRVPWIQLSLDAAIFTVGFGALFWFLVIHPAASHVQLGLLKETLSQAYLACDCILLLMLGVVLLAGAGSEGGWRVPVLLLSGFATMFLADILWTLAKVRGYYLPADLQDVLYLGCSLPLAAAGRAQMRSAALPVRAIRNASDTLTRSLPFGAMLAV